MAGDSAAVPRPSGRHWPFWSDQAAQAVADLVRADDLAATRPPPVVEELERRFASLHCPDGRALWCASGTAALTSAYFGLGLAPEDEVLVPAATFRATVTPLLALNLRPVFYDVHPDTGTADLTDMAGRVTARTRALVVTHLWGRPADLDAIGRLAAAHGLAVVEDCSHAHGGEWAGRPVGSLGTAAAFSLGTKKMVSGGTGGMLVTDSPDVFERAVLFGQPRPRAEQEVRSADLRRYVATGLGANLRGSPIAAALALEHLERLSETIAVKAANLRLLDRVIAEHLPALRVPAAPGEWTAGSWYAYPCVWTDERTDRADRGAVPRRPPPRCRAWRQGS